MIYCDNSTMHRLSIHFVGNKSNNERCGLSKSILQLNDTDQALFMRYFLSPFKLSEYFNLYHDMGIEMNEVFTCADTIFANPDTLLEQSANLARHLYAQSMHPKIKGGEFYTAYFKDCIVDGEIVEAVGLFKSENKDTFLKVYPAGDGFEVESEKGININKLDKGCLIFNTEREKGYIVAVVDNTNKDSEAQYWIDDFLHVRPRQDDYHATQNIMSLCKNFVRDELPQQFDVSKADQIDLLNKSVKFFKEKDRFHLDEFTHDVMEQPEVAEKFRQYKTAYAQEFDMDIDDDFAISDNAVRKQARVFRSVIKLDKNFHIYIHGDRQLIEQGVDDHGRKYYKIYYQRES
ncbi:MAG: nucleoid-associated protein [Prevotellaceae bacterium]|nr:nucleoid-associated protein [Prevotellaceae bacterium]